MTTSFFSKNQNTTIKKNQHSERGFFMKAVLSILLVGCVGIAMALSKTPLRSDTRVNHYAPHHHWKSRSITLYSGSLRDNISRVARQYGWKKVVWLPNQDYRWVGQARLKHQSVYSVFSRVLKHYPLQAVFYKGNRVLVITSRNI